ncbi:sulfotransferase family 2 domain-containing protein [Nocardioides sp.]|uniref:sulfotransferase family 2 domain-containing protein n=1 Tax=Nocardioides sp. TaxID=35761 RepID=UPI0035ADBA84
MGVAFTRCCPDARSKTPGVKPPLGRHAPYARILRAEPDVADYWSFAFVRNPWARMVSWWSMVDDWNRAWGPASGKPPGEKMRGNDMWRAASTYSGFEEFVLRGTEELPRVGRPQVHYLRAPGREVDFVGRTENFVDDLQLVEKRGGGGGGGGAAPPPPPPPPPPSAPGGGGGGPPPPPPHAACLT